MDDGGAPAEPVKRRKPLSDSSLAAALRARIVVLADGNMSPRAVTSLLVISAALFALSAFARSTAPAAQLEAEAEDWPAYGRTPGSQAYSPLRDINDHNVAHLGLAWSYDLQEGYTMSAPVEFGGVLYTATGFSIVTALDVVTGRLLWRYDPEVPKVAGYKLRSGWGIRGLAYEAGRVFVGTHDGRLIALDASTGKALWSVRTFELEDDRYITGPPRVFAGKVLIGHGGGDTGAIRGYVTCYDSRSGKQLWRFYTVPGYSTDEPEDEVQRLAEKSWYGSAWKSGGGGAVWHAITYDSELGRVYLGTGNAQPWNRAIRSAGRGDNLFTASIVALDADTGRHVWHYQVNPGDEWDYDAATDLQLATLEIAGRARKVLMQASKNGFFYVIDRTDGKLISAEPFAKVTWASRIDPVSGRPVESPTAHYHGKQPMAVWPGISGAHSWLPMAFSPVTRLVYIPTLERPVLIGDKDVDIQQWQPPSHGTLSAGVTGDFDPDLPGADRSYLQAWDPVRQKRAWSVDTPGFLGGGVMATAGNVVFQGRIDHALRAYAAEDGRVLWSFDARAPVIAPPITYRYRGTQYVTVLTGYGGSAGYFSRSTQAYRLDYHTMPRRVLTFSLGGEATLPPAPSPPALTAPDDPDFAPDSVRFGKGFIAYSLHCAACHGSEAVAAGAAPDLRISPVSHSREAFGAVVRAGTLVNQGMPPFEDLAAEQTEDIRFYLRSRAQQLPRQAH
jgi:quinohemoprotein ethanol dehydrogenase